MTWCAILLVIVALFDAVLGLIGRYWSSRIGEGLIYDLRTAVFGHVQRQPIAFFLALRRVHLFRASTTTSLVRSRPSHQRCPVCSAMSSAW